jgi:hypothetical protein
MRSGVGPFRKLRMGRQLLVQWKADMHEMHRWWPSLIEDEEMAFKRMETIKWRDEREKKRARRKKK